MPFIKFDRKVTEGKYLLMTHGPVNRFPGGILGVSEKLLEELEETFKEKGIRYHRLTQDELKRRNGQRKERRRSTT